MTQCVNIYLQLVVMIIIEDAMTHAYSTCVFSESKHRTCQCRCHSLSRLGALPSLPKASSVTSQLLHTNMFKRLTNILNLLDFFNLLERIPCLIRVASFSDCCVHEFSCPLSSFLPYAFR